ncbi:MAG: hypothetical protein ACI4UK_09630 [Floccifex sp.]
MELSETIQLDKMGNKIKEYHVWINSINPFSMHDVQYLGLIQGIAYVTCVEPCGTILYDVKAFTDKALLIIDTTEDRIKKFEYRAKKMCPYEIMIYENKKIKEEQLCKYQGP